jgi:kynurenine formamidase
VRYVRAMRPEHLPTYRQLLARTDAPPGTAWGLFGPDDQLGTLNLLTPERAKASAAEVRTGEVFALNWDVELPDPSPFRQTPVRHQVGAGGFGRDDWMDRFYLQGSSQWDGLRHIAHPRHGFWNGVEAARVDDPASDTLGIHVVARRGIVARGVLLDVAGHEAAAGRAFAADERFVIGPELLDRVAAAANVTLETGDVLLVRTGWTGWYARLTPQKRAAVGPATPEPGLEPSERMAEWLWDRHVAAVAADNLALECMPLDFREGHALHFWLIPCFGMPIGELWWLDDLAAACARDRRWTFQLVSAPLNVRGGVGSPPNALAIR